MSSSAETVEPSEFPKKHVTTIKINRGPVWIRKRGKIWERIFVMFHSTSVENAEKNLIEGFKTSSHDTNMLGAGIYVSRDIHKTLPYGPVTFRLLVNPGRVCRIDRADHPLRKNWQKNFDSAWVPPNCDRVPSNRQVSI